MRAVINSSVLKGEITAPVSKSAMQRALALALLNNGRTIIFNPGNSNDDLAALGIIRSLGAKIVYGEGFLEINSTGEIKGTAVIDCVESGLSLRMFAAIAGLGKEEIILKGSGSLLKRPIHFIEDVFPLLQVKVKSDNGFLPLILKGPLVPKEITIDGSRSSQYLTGLLFAFAVSATKSTIITVNNLVSKPYIDLSISLLDIFGYKIINENYTQFHVEPAEKKVRDITYSTEADWSNAAFIMVAAAIAGEVKIKGLDLFSMQADRAILDVLIDAGANTTVEGNCILINNRASLKPFAFDATECPDLFPPLVSLAAFCEGISSIKGISRLADKESNRALSLADVFTKMGIKIELQEDEMIIYGGTGIQGANVSSHHDHRIAMACSVAALRATAGVNITAAEAVNKSYPQFYNDLQMLGADVSLTEE